MKLLALLPENYSETVKPRIADIQVINGGVTILYISDPIFIEGATYYRMKGNNLFEVKPEPRPADSIKLSECDYTHMVIATIKSNGETIRAAIEHGRAVTRDFRGDVVTEFPDFRSLANYEIWMDVRIYDMTRT
jgi:hypothetical protein